MENKLPKFLNIKLNKKVDAYNIIKTFKLRVLLKVYLNDFFGYFWH
jgi:hypothetical protein